MERIGLKIEIAGRAVTNKIISLSISDSTGVTSDSCDVSISNSDYSLEIPEKGEELVASVELNYPRRDNLPAFSETLELGRYIVSSHSIVTDGVLIQGSSYDVTTRLKSMNYRVFSGKNLFDVFRELCEINGIRPLISGSLKEIRLDFRLSKIEQSDLHFLTKTCRDYGCYFKQRKDQLAIGLLNENKARSGQLLPLVPVRLSEVSDDWSYLRAESNQYKSIKTNYHDADSASMKSYIAGAGEPQLAIKELFSSFSEAKERADGKLREYLGRDKTLSLTVPLGNPSLMAERVIEVVGFPYDISGPYKILSANHTISSGGFSSSIEAKSISFSS